MKTSDFKNLIVWQRSMELAEGVYNLVKKLPPEERYALSDQMRRAAISIPSNIAEGHGRESKNEFLHFLSIARGSLTEIETQLLLTEKIGYATTQDVEPLIGKCAEISRMIRSLSNNVASQLHISTSPNLHNYETKVQASKVSD